MASTAQPKPTASIMFNFAWQLALYGLVGQGSGHWVVTCGEPGHRGFSLALIFESPAHLLAVH